MKQFLLLTLLFTFSITGYAQRVWMEPALASPDEPVTIYFDDKNSGFWSGDGVYIHSGVVTDNQTGTNWQYVKGNWAATDADLQMQRVDVGSDQLWSITFTPRSYYGVPATTQMYRLAMVFYNEYETSSPGGNNSTNNGGNNWYVDFTFGHDQAFLDIQTNYNSYTGGLENATITFRADKAPGQVLQGASKVYLHSAAVTDGSSSTSWGSTTGNWGQDDGVGQMTPTGTTDEWQITISDIRNYYSLPAHLADDLEQAIYRLAMVFRNADGSLQQKMADGSDIFYNVEPGVRMEVSSPTSSSLFIEQGSSLNVAATYTIPSGAATPPAHWTLTYGGSFPTLPQGSNLNYTLTTNTNAQETLTIKGTDANGMAGFTRSYTLYQYQPVTIEEVPADLEYGPNYDDNDPTKCTLVLPTPSAGKEVIYVVGTFNNFTPSEAYKMKRNAAGTAWWLTLTNLSPETMYVYQYLVDGDPIGDPYGRLVSDPDDQFIDQSRFEDLPAYPSSETSRRATILQTRAAAYAWQVNNFERPAPNKLNIYELHVRDFTTEQTFDAVTARLDYLKSLGINTIGLMPVNEFEGNDSWGYNPNFYFAVDKWYGTPEDLKRLVDEAHKRGMAVLGDIVLNHSFYSSPFARLYWNKEGNRPAADNPWFNEYHNFVDEPAAHWGADINHESTHTEELVDEILDFWLTEYKLDGFRFDFTKGFSNTEFRSPDNWGSNYDAARVANLKRMVDEMWEKHPGSYAIFEHLANANEDSELANYGILMWGGHGITKLYEELVLGWNNNQDLSGALASSLGYTLDNLLSYSESHDEERLAYRIDAYSRDFIKNSLAEKIKRLQLNAAFNVLLPGPRMIWQFQELGYDYSIDYNGRTGQKPVRWDYYDDTERKKLYDLYATLFKLRNQHEVFHHLDEANSTLGSSDWIKRLQFEREGVQVVVLGNFQSWNPAGGTSQDGTNFTGNITFDPNLPYTGTWYNVLTGTEELLGTSMTIGAGDFVIYSSIPLEAETESFSHDGVTWSADWDDTNLYITIAGADVNIPVNIYFDTDPVLPATSGTGTTDGFTYDEVDLQLPFSANAVVYSKNGYSETRTNNGSGWSGAVTTTVQSSIFNDAISRKVTIPWTNLGLTAKPAAFNWLGTFIRDNGGQRNLFGGMPSGNPNNNLGATGTEYRPRNPRYFTIISTASPAEVFRHTSLTHSNSTDIYNDLNVFNFTLASGSISINSGQNWNISGDMSLAGGTLAMAGNNRVYVSGNVDMSGATFTPSADSYLVLNGTGRQKLKTGTNTLTNLQLLNEAGIDVSGQVTVSQELLLEIGVVSTTATDLLVVADGATTSSASEISYVDGPLQKTGTTAFTFPLGNSGIFAPLSVEQLTKVATGDSFTARYLRTAAPNNSSINTNVGTFEQVSQIEFWELDEAMADPDATARVRLHTYSTGASGISGNASDIVVAHYNGSQWENVGSNGLSVQGDELSIQSDALSSFSPFTFGSGGVSPLPVELVQFSAARQQNEVRLTWQTATEVNNEGFEVQHSADAQHFEAVAFVPGKGNNSYYSYLHTPETAQVQYYRLRQVDTDGTFSFSKVAMVNSTAVATTAPAIAWPNPAASGTQLQLSNMRTGNYQLFNAQGRLIWAGRLAADGRNAATLNLPDITSGMYLLKGAEADLQHLNIKLLIE